MEEEKKETKKEEGQPSKYASEKTSSLAKKLSELSVKDSQAIKILRKGNEELLSAIGKRAARRQSSAGGPLTGARGFGSRVEMPQGYSKKGRQ